MHEGINNAKYSTLDSTQRSCGLLESRTINNNVLRIEVAFNFAMCCSARDKTYHTRACQVPVVSFQRFPRTHTSDHLLASRFIPNAMGWFFASASTGSLQKSSDGGSIAPSRSSREQCYTARDLFFHCLDEKDIVDAIKEDAAARSKCMKELQDFEDACSKTWVRNLLRQRFLSFDSFQTRH
jgi:cytochrome c oxidase assembly factor 6